MCAAEIVLFHSEDYYFCDEISVFPPRGLMCASEKCFVFFRCMRPVRKASGQSDLMSELDGLRLCSAIDPVLSNDKVKLLSPICYAPLYR